MTIKPVLTPKHKLWGHLRRKLTFVGVRKSFQEEVIKLRLSFDLQPQINDPNKQSLAFNHFGGWRVKKGLRTMVIPCATFLSKTKDRWYDSSWTSMWLSDGSYTRTHCCKVTREISKILVISKENLYTSMGKYTLKFVDKNRPSVASASEVIQMRLFI